MQCPRESVGHCQDALSTYRNRTSYPLFESRDLIIGQSVRLRNNGNQVDLGVEPTHHLDVQGLQRMASGLNEIDASVNAVVNNVHTVDLVFRIEVSIETLLNVLHNRAPGVIVVDKVTETGGINNGQTEPDTILLNVGADGLDSNGLGNDVERRGLALLGRVEGGVKERVDESRLSEPGFTYVACQLPAASAKSVRVDAPTTITLKLKPLRTLLRCH